MAVAVQADLVTGRDDLASERGVAPHLLADEEEGRPHTRSGEDLEHRRGALAVRPVVEGERIAACRSPCDPRLPSGRRSPGQIGAGERGKWTGQGRRAQPAR